MNPEDFFLGKILITVVGYCRSEILSLPGRDQERRAGMSVMGLGFSLASGSH